ncbi:MAG: CHAT domain-containing protein [Cyclobacteriaceae bacterium]|nr:CHAT domain-containing protein [Cyclobacteriaceae bacterium]
MKYISILILLFTIISARGQVNRTADKAEMSAAFLEKHPSYQLFSLMQSGDAAKISGNLEQAEEKYIEAIALTKKMVEQGESFRHILYPSIFDSYDRLAALHLATRSLDQAEKVYKESLDLRSRLLPKHSIFRASPYLGLGQTHFQMGKLEEARSDFLMALQIIHRSTTSFVKVDVFLREAHAGLFEIYMALGDRKNAYRYLRRSASGGLYDGTEQIPDVFEKQARYYLHTGNLKRCAHYLQRAKVYARKLTFSPVYRRVLRTEALMLWTERNYANAGNTFRRLAESYREIVSKSFSRMTEMEREQFAGDLRYDTELFASFVLARYEAGDKTGWAGSIFNNQLFGKGLLLNEINKIKTQILRSGDSTSIQRFHEWEKMKGVLSQLYLGGKKNEQQITQTEQAIEILEKNMTRHSQITQSIRQIPDWRSVAAALDPDAAAVEVVRARRFTPNGNYSFSDSVAYLFSYVTHDANAPEMFALADGGSLEKRGITYYRNCIVAQLEDTRSYQLFWGSVQQHLQNYRKLFLSADGVYNQLNPATLYDTIKDQYLLDQATVIQLTSTRDLLQPRSGPGRKAVELFGNPDFNSRGLITSRKTRAIEAASLDQIRSQDFQDLPGTASEIKSVDSLMQSRQWSTRMHAQAHASESELKRVDNPGVLHLATHGYFIGGTSSSQQAMIRSGLILTGVHGDNDREKSDDGVLTAMEASTLKLDETELVVLSACETGLGEIANGEGVYGLQRGFTVAGAHNLLMSLWKVDDDVTRQLMKQFYTNWTSHGQMHTALKEAQQQVRKQYPHPYYWGSFILLGN